MPLSKQKKNFIFIIFAITSTIMITFFSYFYFSSTLFTIESTLNKGNNEAFINSLDKSIKHNTQITLDYAHNNDTFSFVQTYTRSNKKNNDKRYKLTKFDLNFMFIKNKNNDLYLSKIKNTYNYLDLKNIKDFTNKTIKKFNIQSTIQEINNKFYIITSQRIQNTKKTQKSNAYFFAAKEVDKEKLLEYNAQIFAIKAIKNKFVDTNALRYGSSNFKKILVSTSYEKEYIVNDFHFFNEAYLFSIKTQSKYILLEKGKDRLLLYSFLMISSLILIFFLIYKYQKFLNINTKQLERLVNIRSRQSKIRLKKLEKVNEKLYTLAHIDHLTKINNRRNFFLLSNEVLNQLQNKQKILSILMIDIDNFKQINDTYGHAVGDQILQMFVNSFKPHLKKDDIFGRLGGEEFAITLPYSDLEQARVKAEILRTSLQQIFIQKGINKITVTASFGVADSSNSLSIDDILLKADKLLYAAKKSGKNKVRTRIMPIETISEQIQNL